MQLEANRLITPTIIPVQAEMSAEQSAVFMDVIAESLHVAQRSHLFNWLQGGLQYLLSHEVMIYGLKNAQNEEYRFEYFTNTRYFDLPQFNKVIHEDNGIITQALKYWKKYSVPVFVTPAAEYEQGNNKMFAVFNQPEDALKQSELGSFVLHGFGQDSSFVVFARLHKPLQPMHASILSMLMPHLHCAIVQVMSKAIKTAPVITRVNKRMTGREAEVIQWVHVGKTNWEISNILNISPLTVKNHVQNIIRKLEVHNRRQAAIKAVKLGFIKSGEN